MKKTILIVWVLILLPLLSNAQIFNSKVPELTGDYPKYSILGFMGRYPTKTWTCIIDLNYSPTKVEGLFEVGLVRLYEGMPEVALSKYVNAQSPTITDYVLLESGERTSLFMKVRETQESDSLHKYVIVFSPGFMIAPVTKGLVDKQFNMIPSRESITNKEDSYEYDSMKNLYASVKRFLYTSVNRLPLGQNWMIYKIPVLQPEAIGVTSEPVVIVSGVKQSVVGVSLMPAPSFKSAEIPTKNPSAISPVKTPVKQHGGVNLLGGG